MVMELVGFDTVSFKGMRCLIAVGCFWLNSDINQSEWMWVRGSQLSCASEKPFHLTKYCNCFRRHLAPNISSTSHSGCPSIRSGVGSGKFTPCSLVSLYGVRRDA